MLSQDKIVVADALLSLSECNPSQKDVTAVMRSSQDEILEFVWIRTSAFYRKMYHTFQMEKERSSRAANREALQSFRNEKVKELSVAAENVLEEQRRVVDLRLSCEMKLMKQYFRQELWMRIQVICK